MRRASFALTAAAAVVLSLVGVAAQKAAPAPPDVDALLQHLDDLYRSKSSIARIEIDVTTTRSTRNLRLRAWTRGEEEVLVLRLTNPEALLATTALVTSAELAGVARDAHERMVRVRDVLRQSATEPVPHHRGP